MSAQATAADVLRGDARWCVVEGDASPAVASLPGGAFDALVTDPPSGIAFMGAEWDRNKGGRAQWVAWLAGILADCRRATRDGGRSLVWSLPRTSHWTGAAVEDAGWSIETTIAHLFGTGWPKGASQLKPAQETWWLARNGRSEPLQVDACRVTGGGASPAVARRETARRTGNTPGKPGEYGRTITNRITPEAYMADREGESAGRYPPNLLLSHADGCVCEGTRRVVATSIHGESTATRGESVHAAGGGALNAGRVQPVRGHADPDGMESVEAWRCVEGCPVLELDRQSGRTASTDRPRHNVADNRVYGASQGPRVTGGFSDEGTASRFFPQFPADDPDAPWSEALFRYVAKPSRAERNVGCAGLPEALSDATGFDGATVAHRIGEDGRITPKAVRGPQANHHPTVKPVALMRWLIRLVTKPGDVVLDPFGGSGTTGVAALLEGRRVVLVEREPAFVAIIRARCAAADGSDWTRPVVARPAALAARGVDSGRQLSLLDAMAGAR